MAEISIRLNCYCAVWLVRKAEMRRTSLQCIEIGPTMSIIMRPIYLQGCSSQVLFPIKCFLNFPPKFIDLTFFSPHVQIKMSTEFDYKCLPNGFPSYQLNGTYNSVQKFS